jgi:hypothetical protein
VSDSGVRVRARKPVNKITYVDKPKHMCMFGFTIVTLSVHSSSNTTEMLCVHSGDLCE